MKKYNVHLGVRYTTDYVIEAENEQEAIEIAETYMCDATPERLGDDYEWVWRYDDADVWEIN